MQTINSLEELLRELKEVIPGRNVHPYMVIPVTLSSEHTYDLSTILRLYKEEKQQLTGPEIFITCPNTNKSCKVKPDDLEPNTILYERINEYLSNKTYEEFVSFPNDIEIIKFILKNYIDDRCVKYVNSGSQEALKAIDQYGNTVAHLASI